MSFDLVIRGGTVVTAADTVQADVGIVGETIAAVGQDLRGAREIDAGGLLVLPGGIDSHVHIEQRSSSGLLTADDFVSGTRSAAAGGNTTVIPFAAQQHGDSVRDVVEAYHRAAGPKALVDYAFHMIVSDPTPQVMGQELPALIERGYTSFKVYMTYDALKLDDRQMLEVLALARTHGAMTMVHAENHDVIAWLSDRLLAAGHTAPKFHSVAHAAAAEREATHRVITLAEIVDVPMLIVHVSGREAIEQILWAQGRGLKVYAETCPQYLFLSTEDLDVPGFEGAKCMCSPPPRGKDNQRFVWEGLKSGVFQVVSSDHAPYRFDGPGGKKAHGPNPDFKHVANGVPGIGARLPLLFSAGVGEGRLTLNQFVQLTSTNHAKLYGLYPRKGTIAPGADADLALWDPTKEVRLGIAVLQDAMDYTPYEGRVVRGWPVKVLSRGEVVVDDGKVTDRSGRGRFLPCAKPEPAIPLGRAVHGFAPSSGRFKAEWAS
jgi:dihydropyrimidinase